MVLPGRRKSIAFYIAFGVGLISVILILVNILSDILYGLLDPRVRIN